MPSSNIESGLIPLRSKFCNHHWPLPCLGPGNEAVNHDFRQALVHTDGPFRFIWLSCFSREGRGANGNTVFLLRKCRWAGQGSAESQACRAGSPADTAGTPPPSYLGSTPESYWDKPDRKGGIWALPPPGKTWRPQRWQKGPKNWISRAFYCLFNQKSLIRPRWQIWPRV